MNCTWFQELVNELFNNIEKLDINNVENQIIELFGDRLAYYEREFNKISFKFRTTIESTSRN